MAYILFFRILGSAGATNIALVTFLIPPSAIVLSALVLGERLAARDFAGMALVALGLAAIDRRSAGLVARLWRGRPPSEEPPPVIVSEAKQPRSGA